MFVQIGVAISLGYLIYLAALCVLNIFFAIKISKNNLKILLGLMVVSLSFISYVITPKTNGMDICRYFDTLEIMSHMTIQEAFISGEYRATPLANLLFFAVAKIGDFNLIKVVPTIISTLCISYIVYRTAYNKNTKCPPVFILPFIVYLFASFKLIGIFTGVRMPIATFLLCVALFRDIYLNKKDLITIILYILPLMFHSGVILIIVVRILSLLRFRRINVLLVFVPLLLSLILKYFKGLTPLLDEIIDKYYSYLNHDYGNLPMFISFIIKFVIYGFITNHIINKNYDNYYSNKPYIESFIKNLMIVQTGCIPIQHLFARNDSFFDILIVPLLYIYLNSKFEFNSMMLVGNYIPWNKFYIYRNGATITKGLVLSILFVFVVMLFWYQAWGLGSWYLAV